MCSPTVTAIKLRLAQKGFSAGTCWEGLAVHTLRHNLPRARPARPAAARARARTRLSRESFFDYSLTLCVFIARVSTLRLGRPVLVTPYCVLVDFMHAMLQRYIRHGCNYSQLTEVHTCGLLPKRQK